MTEQPGQSRGRWLCRLGIHGQPRSQGDVGYCPRGCGDLKRVHNGGAIWTRYTVKPTGPPPRGLPPEFQGFILVPADPSWADALPPCVACGRDVPWADALLMPCSSSDGDVDAVGIVHRAGCAA